MGANAQTSVPLFVANSVLTAAQQNISAATGVPVFATSVTRDAAFGGSNKVLAEGQLCYLESTNVTQYYDGAAWQPVGATPGLVCVKAETAFSAVVDFFADSVFTSTYTNYRIILRYFSATGDPFMQFRAATVDTTSGYNWQRLTASSTTISGISSTSQSSAQIAQDTGTGTFYSLATIEISGVQLAEPTTYQALNTRSSAAYTQPVLEQMFGNQSASTAFDGIKIGTPSGTMTGSYTIYGYSKAV